RVELVKDPKLRNAATFTMLKDDRMCSERTFYQLLKNRKVLFAVYKMSHPLDQKIELKVQNTDTNPLALIQQVLNNL
ncbi:hypothetical protein BJ742DRAFT_659979, partial [Cladochytrium replicatum]